MREREGRLTFGKSDEWLVERTGNVEVEIKKND